MGIGDWQIMLQSGCEFCENRQKEGCGYLIGEYQITPSSVQ
jgi:hypothetical protein